MKYTKAMIEAIELEVEDVLLTSGGTCIDFDDCPDDIGDCPRFF